MFPPFFILGFHYWIGVRLYWTVLGFTLWDLPYFLILRVKGVRIT